MVNTLFGELILSLPSISQSMPSKPLKSTVLIIFRFQSLKYSKNISGSIFVVGWGEFQPPIDIKLIGFKLCISFNSLIFLATQLKSGPFVIIGIVLFKLES